MKITIVNKYEVTDSKNVVLGAIKKDREAQGFIFEVDNECDGYLTFQELKEIVQKIQSLIEEEK
jgi:hypothetical protein